MNSLRIGAVAIFFAGSLFGQATLGGCPAFPANHVWNTRVDNLPADSHSADYINNIAASGTLRFDITIPINYVAGTQAMVPITITDGADESDPGPYPIPPNPLLEDGSDQHILVVDKDHCMLYELFYATPNGDGSWTAYSAAKWSLLSHALRPQFWTSADAAGLPITPGLIRYDEVASGQVNHAFRFTAPRTQRLFIWPARHYASANTSASLPPMGQRFRLKAGFDISSFTPRVQTILRAMKQYGIILADNGLPWEMQFELDPRWDFDELLALRDIPGSNLEAVDESGLMMNIDSGQVLQTGAAPMVTVTPASTSLSPGQSQPFTATITGSALGVNWTVTPAIGTVSASGLYTAPASVSSMQNVTVTATLTNGSASGSATVTLQPAPAPTVASVSVFPTVATGGSNVSVTVTLTGAAPMNGAAVTLTGSNAAFPIANVTVGAGSAVQTFSVPTAVVTAATVVTITAAYNGSSKNTILTLTPNPGLGNSSNLAMGKTATQSSSLAGYGIGGAAAAVDGNTDGNFFNGSVTHTNSDANAWWQVDLGASANIASIVISNRTDCCGERLGDYWVFVSNTPFGAADTPGTLQNRAGTWSSHQTFAPNPSATITANAQGRYVRVQLTGINPLSLAEVQVMGTAAPGTNLASGKTATQSSTLAGYAAAAAGAAIDGNTDGNFFHGSVTHTNSEANAWWQVDLGASANITSIVISNRTDCCGERLGNYWVFVSDMPFGAGDTPATLQNRAGTWSSYQTSAPNPSASITANAQGRYVRVQLTGTNPLSLAEVQVTGTAAAATNLALGKTATQSSTLAGYGFGGASAAVDGNTDGNFFDGSVTHTNSEAGAWWEVDLGASANITSIVISNRTDCCSDRLNDYRVYVSDTPFNSAQLRSGWSSHQTVAPNPSTTISVNAQGRYVRIQLTGTNSLTLAEVQVIGTAAGGSNLAPGRTATQSSTLAGYATAAAGAAIDGNTGGNFFDGSVTHTNSEANAWWQIDLGASANISSLEIFNRTDCCGERLGDYWIFISDTPFNSTDTPAGLQSRAATWSNHQTSAPDPSATIAAGAQGRYVRIQLSGANSLSLAEVRVIGIPAP